MPKKSAKKTTKKAVKKAVKKVTKKSIGRSVTKSAKSAKRAGRPKGSGKYGCETKAVRVPAYMVDEIQAFIFRKMKSDSKKK